MSQEELRFNSPPWQRHRRESSPKRTIYPTSQSLPPFSLHLGGKYFISVLYKFVTSPNKEANWSSYIVLLPAMRSSPSLSSSLRSATCLRVTSFTSSPRLICHSAKAQTIATPTTRIFSGGSASLLGLRLREPLLQAQRSFFPGFPSPNCALQSSVWSQERWLSTSPILREVRSDNTTKKSLAGPQKSTSIEPELEAFGRSEKATKAAQVNLSARLHKDGNPSAVKPGLGEIVRLLKIARPEAKWLAGA